MWVGVEKIERKWVSLPKTKGCGFRRWEAQGGGVLASRRHGEIRDFHRKRSVGVNPPLLHPPGLLHLCGISAF